MIARLWNRSDAVAIALRIALLPFSALYWVGWKGYLAIYGLGLKRPSQPHRPIVIVGNFTVGGSGKTPITIYIAKILSKNGLQVVIGCSGYGSPRSKGASIAPGGTLDPHEWGDEPAEIREALPHTPLIVGRARVDAAKLCHEHFPEAVFLLDDGLQHLPLQADVRIAIDPPSANRFVLPAGPYREPASSTRVDLALPGKFQPLRKTSIEVASGSSMEPSTLSNAKVQVLCAIGNPQAFVQDLTSMGLEVTAVAALRDHDPMTAGTIFDSFEPETPIVVTQKDWVKLRHRSDLSQWKLWIARLEAHIEPEEEFCKWLLPRLLAKDAAKPHI